MKRPSFVKVQTDIKRPLLDSIVGAFLIQRVDTRAKARKMCGASLSSVGKVAAALVESGFMSERTIIVKLWSLISRESRSPFTLYRENPNVYSRTGIYMTQVFLWTRIYTYFSREAGLKSSNVIFQ